MAARFRDGPRRWRAWSPWWGRSRTACLSARCQPDDRVVPWLQGLQLRKAELVPLEHSAPDQVQRCSELTAGQLLYESLVVFENYPLDVDPLLRGGDLHVRDVRGTATANVPLMLIALPGERLVLRLRYDGFDFAEAAIRGLLTDIQSLLSGMASQPMARLVELPLEAGCRE